MAPSPQRDLGESRDPDPNPPVLSSWVEELDPGDLWGKRKRTVQNASPPEHRSAPYSIELDGLISDFGHRIQEHFDALKRANEELRHESEELRQRLAELLQENDDLKRTQRPQEEMATVIRRQEEIIARHENEIRRLRSSLALETASPKAAPTSPMSAFDRTLPYRLATRASPESFPQSSPAYHRTVLYSEKFMEEFHARTPGQRKQIIGGLRKISVHGGEYRGLQSQKHDFNHPKIPPDAWFSRASRELRIVWILRDEAIVFIRTYMKNDREFTHWE